MSELKPCPYCGGTNVHIEYEQDDFGNETGSYICCYDCLASFFQQEACSAEDNVEAWNKRIEPKPQKGKWIDVNKDKWNTIYIYKCSECGDICHEMPILVDGEATYNFCPNCGADMRGEDDER